MRNALYYRWRTYGLSTAPFAKLRGVETGGDRPGQRAATGSLVSVVELYYKRRDTTKRLSRNYNPINALAWDNIRARTCSYYEDLACGVIQSCYMRNKDMARHLLVRELKSWGNATALSLAECSKLMVRVNGCLVAVELSMEKNVDR